MQVFQSEASDSVYSVICACDDALACVLVSIHGDGSIKLERGLHSTTLHSAFVCCAKVSSFASSASSKGISAPCIISGGFDSKVKVSDLYGKALHEFDLNQQSPSHSGNVKQLFNPPYVHSLDIHSGGSWVVVASGNGSLELLNLEYKVRSEPTDAHPSSVNFVTFASIPSPSSTNQTIVISAGNDSTLAFRTFEVPKIEKDITTAADIRGRQAELHAKIAASNGKSSKPQLKLLNSFTSQLAQLKGTPTMQLVKQMKFEQKINWVTATSRMTTSGNVFVADTSDSVTCFRVLMQ